LAHPKADFLRCDDGPSIFERLGIANAVSGVIAPLEREAGHAQVSFRTADVEGFKYFLSRSGADGRAKRLLLHGSPSVSRMFRDLVPRLADRFHL